MIAVYLLIIYSIIPIIISLLFYIKYKLIPAIYFNLWLIILYLIIFVVGFNITIILGSTKMLIGLIIYIIALCILVLIFKNSIKKGIKLRLNKNLLLNGKKIQVNKLKYKTYKTIKGCYLGYYTGSYIDDNGKKHKFESEDYLDFSHDIFITKKSKKKEKIIIYVNSNNANKYYYKLDDFNSD